MSAPFGQHGTPNSSRLTRASITGSRSGWNIGPKRREERSISPVTRRRTRRGGARSAGLRRAGGRPWSLQRLDWLERLVVLGAGPVVAELRPVG
jgi:hypothetical protein